MNITEAISENPYLRILLKAESGDGKSIQAASFPNVYFFDFDDRIKSVINFFRRVYPNRSDINFDYYPVSELEKAYRLIESWIKYGCPYNTVVLDTTTTLIQSTLFYINKMKGQMPKSNKPGGKDSFGMSMKLGFIEKPALDDFGYLVSAMRDILVMTKNLKETHVIYNAHIKNQETTDLAGNTTLKRMVLAPAATANEIPIHFDEIYHLNVEATLVKGDKAKRIISTESNSMDFARTAYNLPRLMDVTDVLLYDQLCEHIPGLKEVAVKKETKKTNQITF